MRESVVLPAPDGEDRTSINPRRAIETFGPGGLEAVLLLALFLAAAFLLPVFVRPVFFWPVAGVLAILTPSKCPADRRAARQLFQILHLLAKLLDHRLELKPDVGKRHVVRLGAERIGFAVELLRQEVEPSPDRFAVGDQALGLRDMRGQAIELLANVGLAGDQDRFLMQPVRIK